MTSHFRLDADGRANGGSEHARTGSGGFEIGRLTRVGVSLRGRFSRYSSDVSDSRLMTLAIGGTPTQALHVQLSSGSRTTTDRIAGSEESVRWKSADFDLTLPGRWFLSGSFERDRGGLDDVEQAYGSLSWRF